MNELMVELYSRQSWLETQMTDNARKYRALGREPLPEALAEVNEEYELIKLQLQKIMQEIEAQHEHTIGATEHDLGEDGAGRGR